MVEVKEVRRNAKVGEYIKIVNAWWSEDKYENGDILQVEKICNENLDMVHCKGIDISISVREYVVLEGYEPIEEKKSNMVKEVKRGAKVGEWIKIVNEDMSDGEYKNGDILEVVEIDDYHSKTDVFCKGINIHIGKDEYVVLENYQPSTPSHPSFLLKYYIAKLSDGNIENFDYKCEDVEVRGDFVYFCDIQKEVLAIIPNKYIRGIYLKLREEENDERV